MQANDQTDAQKIPKRSKSITRYPKIMPTYVVAFAMHETYDDLMTAQQMICKRSPQGSINSVTPTNSVKILDTNPTEKFTHINDMSEDNESGKVKDANQCPDKAPENIMIDADVSNETLTNVQPEVIFNANRSKRLKDDNNFKKKCHKKKRSSKFRDLNFKCKNCKSMTKKIELHYTESKRNAVANDIVEKGLCNLSNVINQSRVLKKVLAVENLLEEQPLDNNSTEEFSSISSSTTKKSIFSHSSDNTITRKCSSSSSRNFYSSIHTSSSVIQVSSENVIPYKTDVINVAVAVAFNKNKGKEHKLQAEQYMAMGEEIYLTNHDLTSNATIILPPVTLTSKSPSFEMNPRLTINPIEDASSNATLIDNNKKSSVAMSIDEDTFVIARTSSDFNKASLNSNSTLTNSENQSDDTITGNEGLTNENEYNKRKLLDTVINLGMFPESHPSTSKFNDNAVIITKEHKTYATTDDVILNNKDNLTKNILRKTFDIEKNVGVQKIITLPDEAAIRSKLKASHEYQRKPEAEFQNSAPSTLTDLWERIVLLLDAALKRIEESLPDRIIKEIKKALDFGEYKNFFLKVLSEKKDSSIVLKDKVNKGVSVDMVKTETDQNLQCDLVQNQVIDRLMIKLFPEGPTRKPSPKFSQKVITKIFKEYFEVKSPGASSAVKESTTISENEVDLATDVERLNSLKVMLTVPFKFAKENAFVIISVPTFLLILLCMYGLVVFIMNL